MASTDDTFNLWNLFRFTCLLGGLTLFAVAYFAPDWVAQYVAVDTVWGVALLLLLLLPATMVIRFGSERFRSKLRAAGRRAAIQKASAGLAEWAERHDLKFEAATQPGEVGSVQGKYRGFLLLVDPDVGDIRARFNAGLPTDSLHLSTAEPPHSNTDDHEDLETFETEDARFDEAFPTRRATPQVAALFRQTTAIRDALTRFWDEHKSALEELTIDGQSAICFVEPDSQYDADVLEAVIEDLADVMETLERRFDSAM